MPRIGGLKWLHKLIDVAGTVNSQHHAIRCGRDLLQRARDLGPVLRLGIERIYIAGGIQSPYVTCRSHTNLRRAALNMLPVLKQRIEVKYCTCSVYAANVAVGPYPNLGKLSRHLLKRTRSHVIAVNVTSGGVASRAKPPNRAIEPNRYLGESCGNILPALRCRNVVINTPPAVDAPDVAVRSHCYLGKT